MIEQYDAHPDQGRPCAVLYAGRERCAPGHRWQGVRDHFLVHYVTEGRGMVWVQGRPVALESGSVFFFGPAETLRYQADWNRPWSYVWVGFTGTDARRLHAEHREAAGSPVSRAPFHAETAATIWRIAEVLARNGRGSATIAAGLLQTAVGSITANLPLRPRRSSTEPLDYGIAAAEFIELNFQKSIRVTDVAERMGIDRSHLSRLFRARWGQTIQGYLISRRMTRARELLRQTTLPVRAVAQSVGYQNYVAFERRFAERTGMAPTAWRETPQAQNAPGSPGPE